MRKLIYTAALCSIPPTVAAARPHGSPAVAFVLPQQPCRQGSSSCSHISSRQQRYHVQSPSHGSTSTRHFASLFDNRNRNKKDDDDNSNFLTKAIDKAKEVGSKYLPAIFGPPSEETQREVRIEQRKRQARREVEDTVGALFKDAPLGMRMMGNLMKPLLTTMAETFTEQTQSIQDVLDDAESFIQRDDIVVQTLGGGPIRVSAPFRQSSSTSVINGRQSSQVQASFQVTGRSGSGVATVLATNGDIESLQVNVDGRMYNVNTSGVATGGASTTASSFASTSSRLGKNANIDKSDVIDAEFVEKK